MLGEIVMCAFTTQSYFNTTRAITMKRHIPLYVATLDVHGKSKEVRGITR